MKTLRFLCAALIAFNLTACSDELIDDPQLQPEEVSEAQAKVAAVAGVEFMMENPETTAQLLQLHKAIAKINTVKQANKAGWDVFLPVYFPNMGFHYLNAPFPEFDDTFEVENPEAIVFECGPNGNLMAVAVEYLVLGETPPEGFAGDLDQWMPVGPNVWALHVWLKKYNPDGIFSMNNPNVAATNECVDLTP